MIPRDDITEWREQAPWRSDLQVEQDLVLSRALVEIFAVESLARRLALRGGAALYKLHLRPAARYTEDLDLVQVAREPIGETFDAIRAVLDPWLGAPRRLIKERRVNLVYRFGSADRPPRRCRHHRRAARRPRRLAPLYLRRLLRWSCDFVRSKTRKR